MQGADGELVPALAKQDAEWALRGAQAAVVKVLGSGEWAAEVDPLKGSTLTSLLSLSHTRKRLAAIILLLSRLPSFGSGFFKHSYA